MTLSNTELSHLNNLVSIKAHLAELAGDGEDDYIVEPGQTANEVVVRNRDPELDGIPIRVTLAPASPDDALPMPSRPEVLLGARNYDDWFQMAHANQLADRMAYVRQAVTGIDQAVVRFLRRPNGQPSDWDKVDVCRSLQELCETLNGVLPSLGWFGCFSEGDEAQIQEIGWRLQQLGQMLRRAGSWPGGMLALDPLDPAQSGGSAAATEETTA